MHVILKNSERISTLSNRMETVEFTKEYLSKIFAIKGDHKRQTKIVTVITPEISQYISFLVQLLSISNINQSSKIR